MWSGYCVLNEDLLEAVNEALLSGSETINFNDAFGIIETVVLANKPIIALITGYDIDTGAIYKMPVFVGAEGEIGIMYGITINLFGNEYLIRVEKAKPNEIKIGLVSS